MIEFHFITKEQFLKKIQQLNEDNSESVEESSETIEKQEEGQTS